MADGDQLFGEQPAAAAKLEDETVAGADGRQQLDDPGSACGCMEPKPAVVHEGEVASIVSGAA